MDNTAPHSLLRRGEMLNWYKIERVLGRGGFGVIYLATDTNLDHKVAIKEYRVLETAGNVEKRTGSLSDNIDASDGMRRFIAEARNLVRFKHPNIVRVMSVFELNDTAYIVMEFEEGIDFREYLQNPINRRESSLKKLLVPIVDGLAQVHQSGFIHRDIKPANILVRKSGSPVLLDFGSARSAHSAQTEPLTALVSAGYAPLEQYSGVSEREQGPWTDIYALGAVLYFAVTGVEPVDSAKRGSAMLNGGLDPMLKARMLGQGQYSAPFLAAIDWALQFRISERPQSLSVWMQAMLRQTKTDGITRKASTSESVTAATTGAAGKNVEDVVSSEFNAGGGVISMHDQPMPKEVEAARARRSGSRQRKWLIGIAVVLFTVLVSAGSGYFLNSAKISLPFSLNSNPTEPASSESAEASAASRENALLLSELERAREEAKGLAAELAQEQKRIEEREIEEEARRLEREAAFAAEEEAAKVRAAAKQDRELAQRRLMTQHLDAASQSIVQGNFDAAEIWLDKAATIDGSDSRLVQLRARWGVAVTLSRVPVSDREFDLVIARFDALRRAIQESDKESMDQLTVTSIQNALFEQLMSKFADLKLSIAEIELNNADKSISAVLRIERMVRANGDLATPSDAYRERRLSSRRIGREWSLIQW
ncbi:MAG: serine/threonine-protein kinase [Granulosicoccus sp.]